MKTGSPDLRQILSISGVLLRRSEMGRIRILIGRTSDEVFLPAGASTAVLASVVEGGAPPRRGEARRRGDADEVTSFATIRKRVFARAHLPTCGRLRLEEVPDERAGQGVERVTPVDQDLRDDRLVDSGERVNDVDQGRCRGSRLVPDGRTPRHVPARPHVPRPY